ncbi:MAG TPA: DUF6600 domain-containing protein [Candidatus Acidoferrum sp.]|nr:DUF6600 domain-containing protein [Candidatus Acidoferrum sp.]
MHRRAAFLFMSLFAILAIIVVAVPPAHSDDVSHARIVRLSFVEGDVAYQRPGSTWQRAMMNLPLEQDYSLRTDSGYAEVEFDGGLMVRLAPNTQLDFTDLSLIDAGKITSIKLDKGTIIATANLSHNDQLSIVSGNLNVTVPRNGRFRMDASQSQNFVTVFHGRVNVATGSSAADLESGKTFHYAPADNESSVDRNQPLDAFDKWVAQRDDAQQSAQSNAADFIQPHSYAFPVDDLYNYGLWYNVSGYGMLWQPYGVGDYWMPFGNGMWIFGDPGQGWMWTSYEPWGWLPYHYGGWVNLPGQGWFWSPKNLGQFQGATANFVNVGNQFGWTPAIAPPTNSGKVKTQTYLPTEVVIAGGASNGMIFPGFHGQLTSGASMKTASGPSPTFTQQAAPARQSLVASGINVTGRAPARPANLIPGAAYTPRATQTVAGAAPSTSNGANNPARTNLNASVNAPVSRPAFLPPPHSAPVAVTRAPSTFANSSNPGSRAAGITPASSGNASASSGVLRGGPTPGGAPGGSGSSGANSGGHSSAPASSTSSSSAGSAVHH